MFVSPLLGSFQGPFPRFNRSNLVIICCKCIHFMILQAIKVLIRQACLLRGEAQTEVQSEIRSILKAVSEEHGIKCVNNDGEQDMKSVGPLEKDQAQSTIRGGTKESDIPIPFDLEDIFAPLCYSCGWIENSCLCLHPLKSRPTLSPSTTNDRSGEDFENSAVLCSSTATSVRGMKKRLHSMTDAASESSVSYEANTLSATRRSTRRRRPVIFG